MWKNSLSSCISLFLMLDCSWLESWACCLCTCACVRMHIGEGESWVGGGLSFFPSSVTAVGVGAAMSLGLTGCSQLVPICGQWELSTMCISAQPQPSSSPNPSPSLSLSLSPSSSSVWDCLKACTGMWGGKALRAHCCRRCCEKRRALLERRVKCGGGLPADLTKLGGSGRWAWR